MPLRFTLNVQSASTTAATASRAYILNQFAAPMNVGFGVVRVSGDVNFRVQHTFEQSISAATTWFDHSSVSGKTANIDGNYAFPINAVRLQLVSASAGQIELNGWQTGN